MCFCLPPAPAPSPWSAKEVVDKLSSFKYQVGYDATKLNFI